MVVDFTLRDAIAEEAIRKSTALDVQGLANIAWSFAKWIIIHVPLIEAISAASIPKISEFTS